MHTLITGLAVAAFAGVGAFGGITGALWVQARRDVRRAARRRADHRKATAGLMSRTAEPDCSYPAPPLEEWQA